jgi:hypothetical protein
MEPTTFRPFVDDGAAARIEDAIRQYRAAIDLEEQRTLCVPVMVCGRPVQHFPVKEQGDESQAGQ